MFLAIKRLQHIYFGLYSEIELGLSSSGNIKIPQKLSRATTLSKRRKSPWWVLEKDAIVSFLFLWLYMYFCAHKYIPKVIIYPFIYLFASTRMTMCPSIKQGMPIYGFATNSIKSINHYVSKFRKILFLFAAQYNFLQRTKIHAQKTGAFGDRSLNYFCRDWHQKNVEFSSFLRYRIRFSWIDRKIWKFRCYSQILFKKKKTGADCVQFIIHGKYNGMFSVKARFSKLNEDSTNSVI